MFDRRLDEFIKAGRYNEAVMLCVSMLRKHPENSSVVDALCGVVAGVTRLDMIHAAGVAALQAGYHSHAQRIFESALKRKKISPDAPFINNLATSCMLQHDFKTAKKYFLRSLRINPKSFAANYNMGYMFQEEGAYSKSVPYYSRALKAEPDNTFVLLMYSRVLRILSKYDEALRLLKKGIEVDPSDYKLWANYLFLLSYSVLLSAPDMLKEHQAWDRVFGGVDRYQHDYKPLDGRKLKVGYVSPDMRLHPVSYFIEPILAGHDRAKTEVYCYAELERPDAITERLKGLSDHWCDTAGMDDVTLAKRIYDDGIDVLVDLAGHTKDNRLRAFTYKPAPVQVSYLGYFTTTGLSAMDYWLTDEVLHAPDVIEQSVEKPWRISRCCMAFSSAMLDMPPVVERSAGGGIVFGCFNSMTKISEDAIALWSRVLLAVPGSTLMLKSLVTHQSAVRRGLEARFASHGIGKKRLRMVGFTETQTEHLEMYGEMDIALDTLPRTGGSTTAEALWMGVPVVTLASDRFIGRLSASMLVSAGLDELIATSEDDYVEIARRLAENEAHRRTLRAGMRARLEASELGDGAGLARELDQVYRDMYLTNMSN